MQCFHRESSEDTRKVYLHFECEINATWINTLKYTWTCGDYSNTLA